jgi:hypothetical protein
MTDGDNTSVARFSFVKYTKMKNALSDHKIYSVHTYLNGTKSLQKGDEIFPSEAFPNLPKLGFLV